MESSKRKDQKNSDKQVEQNQNRRNKMKISENKQEDNYSFNQNSVKDEQQVLSQIEHKHQQIGQWNQQQLSQQYESQQQQQQQQQSQLKQKPAFYIPQEQQLRQMGNVEEIQIQAFQYLMQVRKQAQGIKTDHKMRKQKAKLINRENKRQQRINKKTNYKVGDQQSMKEQGQKQNQFSPKNQLQKVETQQEDQWFTQWQQETLKNWHCIVQNIKYLHNQSTNSTQKNKNTKYTGTNKINCQKLLSQQPLIHHICALQLGCIEEMIGELSQWFYHQHLSTRVNNSRHYYYLWMYSLLAAHQSLAQYRIFQNLAPVNACIQVELDTINKANTCANSKNKNKNQLQILILSSILSHQFSQLYLHKLYTPIIKYIHDPQLNPDVKQPDSNQNSQDLQMELQ